MTTPTETPTRTPTGERVYGPAAHGTTPASTAAGGVKPLSPIMEFPVMVKKEAPEDETEYVVDVETHVTMLVQATTPETAVAKAVLHTIAEEKDGSVSEVGRNVHTCVHSGLDESESCDQHNEE